VVQEFDFLFVIFAVRILYSCEQGFDSFCVILLLAVYTLAGQEFDSFFWMNNLVSYFGACLDSCLQGKWCFKNSNLLDRVGNLVNF